MFLDFPEERGHANMADRNLVEKLAAKHHDCKDGNEESGKFRIHGILLTEGGFTLGLPSIDRAIGHAVGHAVDRGAG
jgi:hypothetical protein